jgi:hypothetical protein
LPRSLLRSLLSAPGPAAAVSVVPGHVTAVQVESGRHGPVACGLARTGLPAESVLPAVHAPNLADPPVVADAIDDALGRLPRRPRRIALLLPDNAAKVSLVRLAQVPARAAELQEMLRWQVRKSVPFRVEEAQMDWSPGGSTADGEQEFVVVLAHRAVVEEYERACTAAGTHAGRIELLSFSLLNTAVACGAGDGGVDWLLVHVGSGSSTLAVVRGRHPLLFRTVAADGEALGDLVHQTAMYYEDRLGGAGFSCALVAGGGATADDVRRIEGVVSQRLAIKVEPIAGRISSLVSQRAALDQAAVRELAAPLGVLLPEFEES